MTDPQQLPLRDIHLPEAVSWWPPAPGWWLVLLLLILVPTALLFWRRYQRRKFLSAVSMARREMKDLQGAYRDSGNARQYAADLSVLLRRLSISAFPRTESASLTGEAWLKFLDSSMQRPAFSEGPGRIMLEAPYRAELKTEELLPLVDVCEEWIEAVAKRKQDGAR